MMKFNDKYINPFTDFGFKKLFGTEFNKTLLIDFINQVLGEREEVKTLAYLNTEHLGRTAADRKAIFDLYCENEKGEKFIIELQNVKQGNFKDRSIFYSTFPIQNQAPKGRNWTYCLKAVYTIGILNFTFSDQNDTERHLWEVMLLDKNTHEIFYDKLMFIYLEMPNFKKAEDELDTGFDKWLYVLKHLSKLQEKPKKLQEKIFEKLFEEAEIAKLNPEDMNKYEESLKIYRDNHNTMEYAKEEAKKIGLEEGREIGKREGRKEGIKEGIKEGMKEGREEGREKERMAIAKMLKKNGASVALIIKSTGLTEEQIALLE